MAHIFSPLTAVLIFLILILLVIFLLSLKLRVSSNKYITASYKQVTLIGQPDFLLKKGRHYIPVEYKSMNQPKHIFNNHLFQLYTYIYILEKKNGGHLPYGILKYKNRKIKVLNTPELQKNWENTLSQLISAAESGVVHRNHTHPAKCKNCEVAAFCPERLV